MNVYEAIIKRRSIRRFQKKEISYEILEKCASSARVAPSASNLQPLEYVITKKKPLLEKIFGTLRWAGYLKKGAPKNGEEPMAYLTVLVNKEIRESAEADVGMAVENILLTALNEGIGSCCIGAIDREKLREILQIPPKYDISLVVALGYIKEKSQIEKFEDSVKYWRDGEGMHVPKRNLQKILHRDKFKFICMKS